MLDFSTLAAMRGEVGTMTLLALHYAWGMNDAREHGSMRAYVEPTAFATYYGAIALTYHAGETSYRPSVCMAMDAYVAMVTT